MESYSTLRADTTIAVGGNQNISFSFVSPELQQRINRNFQTSGKRSYYFHLGWINTEIFRILVGE
jgi:hypothetical protein